MPLVLAVAAVSPADQSAAQALAARLELPLLPPGVPDSDDCDAILWLEGPDLWLRETGPKAPGPVRVDFGAAAMRHRRRAGHNELLGRAVGLGRKDVVSVLDGTAGLGRDAFVLADLGCQVTLCEREPVVAALLESGLARARADTDPWLAGTAGRLALHAVDARALAPPDLEAVDVIYLDPMFPERGKSAAVKKDMALFQQLLPAHADPGETDARDLLGWALRQPVSRVVVKRPLKAGPLADRGPSHQLRGKAVRFDVYVLAAFNRGSAGDPDPGKNVG